MTGIALRRRQRRSRALGSRLRAVASASRSAGAALGAVDALAVPEEQVLRLEAAERAPRRGQAQERVNAERLAAGEEVAEAPERVAADEDPSLGPPQGDLAPDAAPRRSAARRTATGRR